MKNKKLFLFDVMPLLYRAHFATMGKRFGTTTGIDTRTTLVFFNYIFQVLTAEKPDAVAAALDSKAKQRVAVAADYKANRQKMPAEIAEAFPYALRLLDALHIPVLKEEGLEADDIIATIARQGAGKGYTVFIVSPDKDFAQLVTDQVFLFRPAYKGAVMETLGAEGVKEKFGVEPHQIADFLALKGDSVDNIRGVEGIGDKTAAALLAEYHSIEALIEGADSIKQPKVKAAIIAAREQLTASKQLALLTGDAVVNLEWAYVNVQKPDPDKLLPLLDELQFSKMRERLVTQGFMETEAGVQDTTPADTVTVKQLTLAAATKKLDQSQKVAVGFTEQYADDLFFIAGDEKTICRVTLAGDDDWQTLIRCLDNGGIVKAGWLLKPLLKKVTRLQIRLKSRWVDVALAAYLLEPDAKIEWSYIQDKYQVPHFSVSAPYAGLEYLPGMDAANETIMRKVGEMDLTRLLCSIELPLQQVISGMELQGISVDLGALRGIEKVLSAQLNDLEKKLYEEAGMQFNLNSTSKIAEVLQLIAAPSELKKTKTGQISTAEPFLADLAPKYPFIADLLTYRKLNKIISTYVVSLPKWVDPETNKIHPTFQQIVAGTGRLSCTDPNLQNLPVKNEAGREVRKAIVSSGAGYSIVSVDYNQVELRLLAALSEDQIMLEAFRSGKDIHTTTAARVFKVDEKEVTKDMRSKAKSVNFGIAYGITPWGLATRLKISQKEAKIIIDEYFEAFPSVKAYLENSVTESRERGYTRTRYGRIRYVEGIDSRNGTTRKMAERIAVNAPLQGLAADIIKEAMVEVDGFINTHHLTSRLILQVHDELVFDAADDELEMLVPQVIKIMETKAALIVPLAVHVTVGKNWLDQLAYPLQTPV